MNIVYLAKGLTVDAAYKMHLKNMKNPEHIVNKEEYRSYTLPRTWKSTKRYFYTKKEIPLIVGFVINLAALATLISLISITSIRNYIANAFQSEIVLPILVGVALALTLILTLCIIMRFKNNSINLKYNSDGDIPAPINYQGPLVFTLWRKGMMSTYCLISQGLIKGSVGSELQAQLYSFPNNDQEAVMHTLCCQHTPFHTFGRFHEHSNPNNFATNLATLTTRLKFHIPIEPLPAMVDVLQQITGYLNYTDTLNLRMTSKGSLESSTFIPNLIYTARAMPPTKIIRDQYHPVEEEYETMGYETIYRNDTDQINPKELIERLTNHPP